MSNLCKNCKNCITINDKRGIVITEHNSGAPFDWQMYNQPICRLLCVGMREVKKCDHFEDIKKKILN